MKLSIQDNRLPEKNIKEKFANAEEHGFKVGEIWGINVAGRLDEI